MAWSGGWLQPLLGSELRQEGRQILSGERPLKWHGGLLIVILKAEQAVLDRGERGEVVGGQDLALDDREVDLDLIEPTGVDGRVDEHEVRPTGAEPSPRPLAPVG